jgi:hypothetical protein
MRSVFFIVILMMFTTSCGEKIIDVSSVDDIPGTWRWLSTCGSEGDNDYACVNASESNYATIEFRSNGVYIEKHMDTVYLQTNYTISIIDDMLGTLILEDPPVNRPVTVINNRLMIQRGTSEDYYEKIKKD